MNSNTIGFNLVSIKTEQFAVFTEHFQEKKKVDLTTNFQFKLNGETHAIGVFATFQFEQGKKVFIKLMVSCHFDIKQNSWSEFLSEREIRIPANFIRHLSMLTVGTSRGILHVKTEGTLFNDFILPTINLSELIREDVVFVSE
jgi:hypothetical protein